MRYLWPAVLLLIATPLMASEVYRSFDADGNVVYSDRPDRPGAEPIRIIAPTAPLIADATAAQPESAPEDSEPLGAEIVGEPSTEEEQALRAHNCEIARERQQLYSMSRRLFRTLADGEREYLSDDEMDQAREVAARDVDTWCD